MVATAQDWTSLNQQHILAELARIRHLLEDRVEPDGPSLETGDNIQAELPDAPLALPTLVERFGLTDFERDVLLLCAGVEMDSRFGPLCAAANGDPGQSYPTFSLALAVLENSHWSALTPSSALRYWRLIEIGAGPNLLVSRLRIDERILHYLAGVQHLDENLTGFVELVRTAPQLVPSQRVVSNRIAAVWSSSSERMLPAIQLTGKEAAGKVAVAAAACASLGLSLYRLVAQVIPTGPAERDVLLRLWEREVALSQSALLIDCDGVSDQDGAREEAIQFLVDHVGGPVIVASADRRDIRFRPLIALDVQRPTPSEQHLLWQDSLGSDLERVNGHIDRLVAQFDLSSQTIHTAVHQARIAPDNGTSLGARQARPRLGDLAQPVKTLAGWDDLVVAPALQRILEEIVIHVQNRMTVYEAWGFAERSARGLGISALFAGASGTGKTMAAEVIAGALQLDLYRIDLSRVVSKYIGETEKNLSRVFDAAEQGGAVLLFDEADALFGKRSEVKDSHDRYANIEVGYLLQRMEEYRGLAILTTNMRSALDDAFIRRIRFIAHFPVPGIDEREAIWRRIFPPRTPIGEIDFERLAQLNITGGSIRNIALNAAFLAADGGDRVSMQHILRAAHNEYAKLERTLTSAELSGWPQ